MSLLEPLASRLVTTTIYLGLAALIVQTLIWLVRSSSPQTRRTAWACVLVSGLLLAPITINVPDSRLEPAAKHAELAVVQAITDAAPPADVSATARPFDVPIRSTAQQLSLSTNDHPASTADPRSASQAPVAPSPIVAPTPAYPAGRQALLATWAFGFFLLVGWGLLNYIRFARSVMRFERAPDKWIGEWHELLAAHGIGGPISLLVSRDCGPALCLVPAGYRLVVPKSLWESLSHSERLAILRHELAHYERRDLFKSLFSRLVVALHWFNLAAWWARREFEAAGEWACDDRAARGFGQIELARTLMQVAGIHFPSVPLCDAVGSGGLYARIRRLLSATPLGESRLKKSLMIAVSAGIVALGLVRVNRVAVATPPALNSAEASNKEASADSKASSPSAAKASIAVAARVDQLGDPFPPGARLRIGTSRFQHPAIVQEMALSPDAKTIVTLGGSLIAWDTATGKKHWEANAGDVAYMTNGPRYGDRGLAFAPDGKSLYTPTKQMNVTVWDASTGHHRELFVQPPDWHRRPRPANVPNFIVECRSVDASPDGKRLAVGNSDGVIVCDLQGKSLYAIENNPTGPVDADRNDRLALLAGHYSFGQFSPDGKLLAVHTSDKPLTVRIYNAESGAELRRIALTNRLVRMNFSPNSKRLATTERDSSIRLYDVATGNGVWSHKVKLNNPYENYTSAVAFSPDGKVVAAGATDHQIYFCDAATGAELRQLAGHHWYPWCLAFTADGKLLYSAGWDGTIRRWEVAGRKQLPPPAGTRATDLVAVSPDGQTLAYVDDVGIVHVVDSKDGSDQRTFKQRDLSYSQLVFSPDGRRLAAGGADAKQVSVVVWDLAKGQLFERWDWPLGWDPHSTVEQLVFSYDGKRLAAASFRQSRVKIWDVMSGGQVAQLAHREINGLAFSPDGRTLVTAGWDSVIRLWSTDTWKVVRDVRLDEQKKKSRVPRRMQVGDEDPRVFSLGYSPVGGWLATLHLDGNIRVWNAADLVPRRMFRLDYLDYGPLSISPDGLWLATGNRSGQIVVWDPASGRKVWDVGRHQGEVSTLGFGRDSRTVVSGGNDHVGYVWDLRPAEKLPSKDPAALWDDLVGLNGQAAYQAMWALADMPTRASSLIADRALRLLQSSIDGKEAEPSVAVRRVISLLAQIGTPESIGLLKSWLERDSHGALAKVIAAALKRA